MIKLKKKALEELASLEHQQWVLWSKDIADSEDINPERLARWKKLWVPYEELSEEDKNKDREWMIKVLKIFERNLSGDKNQEETKENNNESN